ncbi:hypothetical protein [Caldichromatium japonicum]|uniref:hypothetical protein n=1 Tax=Caldichromatium japonicum TaxID=2699430 RepID=UPI001B356589|nr:hypothetical protein [Caldichromatium japonicum]
MLQRPHPDPLAVNGPGYEPRLDRGVNKQQSAGLCNPEKFPTFQDPFAGSALPLEAQRLWLEAYASDLNPVAITISKAMIEIPWRFAVRPPVSLGTQAPLGTPVSGRLASGRDARVPDTKALYPLRAQAQAEDARA